jgi:hypothetical protein
MFTYADFTSQRCTAAQYIGQFVDDNVRRCVTKYISIKKLMETPSCDDIDELVWVAIATCVTPFVAAPIIQSGYPHCDGELVVQIAQCAASQMRKAALHFSGDSDDARLQIQAFKIMKECLARVMR